MIQIRANSSAITQFDNVEQALSFIQEGGVVWSVTDGEEMHPLEVVLYFTQEIPAVDMYQEEYF